MGLQLIADRCPANHPATRLYAAFAGSHGQKSSARHQLLHTPARQRAADPDPAHPVRAGGDRAESAQGGVAGQIDVQTPADQPARGPNSTGLIVARTNGRQRPRYDGALPGCRLRPRRGAAGPHHPAADGCCHENPGRSQPKPGPRRLRTEASHSPAPSSAAPSVAPSVRSAVVCGSLRHGHGLVVLPNRSGWLLAGNELGPACSRTG